jgi:phage minor structural protein
MDYSKVYDRNGVLLGILQNARVQYTLKDAPLHSAKITLPSDDPANDLCQMGNEVEIFDNGTRIELFRIISSPEGVYTATGGTITYNLEHVAAYLMDDVLFQYHEIGGYNQRTQACIEYVLARQAVVRWQLGTCAFNRQFQYNWENETLLRALLSVPKSFDVDYIWTFDTTARPWTLNLVAPESGVGCEMRYTRNMTEVRKSIDATELVTRLYALGYGEGVNQLTIKDVNGGIPYLDADTQGVWGLRKSIWVDGRFEIAESLKARAQAILEERKNPYISYKVQAVDLYPLTGEPFDRFMPGKLVRVNDQEHGIVVNARVIEITKKDVRGSPGDITVTIANRSRTVADTIAALAGRAAINDLYAQGSTCVYQTSYADNADKDHPATMSLEIPAECVRINKLRLKYTLLPFRSYSQGAAAGGGTTSTTSSGGGTTSTTSSGGGSTQTSSEGGGGTRTSSSGGSTTVTTEQKVVTNALAVEGPLRSDTGAGMSNTDANDAQTSGSNGGQTTSGASNYTTSGVSILRTGEAGGHSHTVNSHSHGGPSHVHLLNNHTHSFSDSYTLAWGHTHPIANPGTSTNTGGVNDYAQKTISISGTTGSNNGYTSSAGTGYTDSASPGTSSVGDHDHAMGHTHTLLHTHTVDNHTHTVAGHTHYMHHFHTGVANITIPSLQISVPSHTHTVSINDHSHNVTIPEHSHGVTISDHTHSLTIDNHTHNLIPGIYDGPMADGITIHVDGTAVPAAAIVGNELDLTPYLSKDEGGKIVRGMWHTITITPKPGSGNANGLTRIEAAVFVMTFARSQGGGDY